jgi:hypothetical protein
MVWLYGWCESLCVKMPQKKSGIRYAESAELKKQWVDLSPWRVWSQIQNHRFSRQYPTKPSKIELKLIRGKC